MDKKQKNQNSKADEDRKSKNEEDRELSKGLEMSFPASDPPAATQPGSGITGPEVVGSHGGRRSKDVRRRP